MSNIVKELHAKKLIQPPHWLIDNVIYLTITGSVAYGAADTTSTSDQDIYGLCIPKKADLFPHLAGKIPQFDDFDCFQQFQQHHILDETALGGKGREYDIVIYNLVKFFKLLLENNPSCIDTLFTPYECVLTITSAGNFLRENRKLFLHKGCWPKFKGYAYSMMHKMDSKQPEEDSKRAAIRNRFGFDVKYAMHLVRLLLEVEQILAEGDLDLRRHREQLKSIRRGEWSIERIKEWAQDKERTLEDLYVKSELPSKADKNRIRRLLLQCLELHYGNLGDAVVQPDEAALLLKQIKEQIERAGF